jgi:hypothetical protein
MKVIFNIITSTECPMRNKSKTTINTTLSEQYQTSIEKL